MGDVFVSSLAQSHSALVLLTLPVHLNFVQVFEGFNTDQLTD